MVERARSGDELVLELFVRNLERSVEFYRRLGFRLQSVKPHFAALAWEGHLLFLAEADEPPGPPPRANLRIVVPDVDRYYKLVQEMGAEIENPLADRPYGVRDFIVRDPDGFGIRFATRLD